MCGRGRYPQLGEGGGMGERCKLPHWGLRGNPQKLCNFGVSALKIQ